MNIYDQLRRDEGVKLFPYKDTVGKITIGVGRNLTDKGISSDEAAAMLVDDVDEVEELLEQHTWYNALDPVRQAALVNMTFNLGMEGMLMFQNMTAALEAKDWDAAAEAMLNSLWAEQVGARAHRLAKQIQTGEWQ